MKIPVVGGTELEVNIGKDIFIDPSKENKYNSETKKIELFLNDGTKIEVPAADLIDIYTGENTNGAHVTVSGDNKISVDVVVDPVEGNKLQLTAAGLKVDLSEYNTATEVDAKVKVAKDAADAAQSKANQAVSDAATAQSKADANETEIGKLAEAITWGTF